MVADEPVDVGLNGIPFYFFRDVEGKGIDEQGPCGGLPYTTGPEVEKRIFAKLPHGCAMAAFHVVGIDLEFRLGIDGRFLADDEVIVLLEGVCLLGVLVYKDLAVEDTGGLFEQDTLVELVTETRRLLMVDEGMVVDQLLTRRKIKPI